MKVNLNIIMPGEMINMEQPEFDSLSDVYEVGIKSFQSTLKSVRDQKYLPKYVNWALDGGCGTGSQVIELAYQVNHIVGLDNSPKMIEIAVKRKAQLGLKNIFFVIGDLEYPPFRKLSFDYIISNFVLHHTDLKISLPATRALTAPGGRILVRDVAPRIPRLNKFRIWHIFLALILSPSMLIIHGLKKTWNDLRFNLNPKWLNHKIEGDHISNREFKKQYSKHLPGSQFPRKGMVVWNNPKL